MSPPIAKHRHLPPAVLLGCLFLSGLAGLMLEVAWSRSLGLLLGTAHVAQSTVIATYMLGLGAGALLFGALADRSTRPARLYAWLETGVAMLALASPLLLGFVAHVHDSLHAASELGATAQLLVRVLIAGSVLLIPTLLMGGSLPLMARQWASTSGVARPVGALYAVNTLGAVVGSGLAGFWALEHLGLKGCIGLAAVLDLVAAGIVLSFRTSPIKVEASDSAEATLRQTAGTTLRAVLDSPLAAVLALLAGFSALVAELVWMRVLGVTLGSSTWSFCLVLIAFLLGIGLGSGWVSMKGAGTSPWRSLAFAQCLAGLGVVTFLVGYPDALRFTIWLGSGPSDAAVSVGTLRVVLVMCSVLPATVGMGMSLPLLVAAANRSRSGVGRLVGGVLASNTLGSLAGALAGGLLFIPLLGSFSSLRLAALLQVLVATLAISACMANATRRQRAASLSCVAGLVLIIGFLPGWPAHVLSINAFAHVDGEMQRLEEVDLLLAQSEAAVLSQREGQSATVSVWDADYTRTLRLNGKPDAGTSADMATQLMLGLLPGLAADEPRSALIIGAGIGVTVDAVRSLPGIETIDVVEIEETVFDTWTMFDVANNSVAGDERVNKIVGDGRGYLRQTQNRYDIIVSEPSNPWVAGVGNLFTREFQELAAARLTPHGVMLQWVPQYELAPQTLKRMVATVLAVHADVELWSIGGSDLLLPCSPRPLAYSLERADELIRREPKGASRWARYLDAHGAEDFFLAQELDRSGLESFAAGSAAFVDDRPEIEFEALRSLGGARWHGLVADELARARSSSPPRLDFAGRRPPGIDDLARGAHHYNLGEFTAAVPHLKRAVDAAPGAAERWRRLADAQARSGLVMLAEASFREAVRRDPSCRGARLRLGELALSRGNNHEAWQHLSAIGTENMNTASWMLRANLATRRGHLSAALEALRQVEAALPGEAYPEPYLDRAVKGYVALAGDHLAAEIVLPVLAKHAEDNPRVPAWSDAHARLLEGLGRFDEALRAHQDLLAFCPSRGSGLGVIRCLRALGRPHEALALLAKLQAVDPDDARLSTLEQELTSAATQLPRTTRGRNDLAQAPGGARR